jgi:hypothetical protein
MSSIARAVRAATPTPTTDSPKETEHGARLSVAAKHYELTDGVAIDYEVRLDRWTTISIRVAFPEETRSLFETLSWGAGKSILTVLDEIGQLHLERLATAWSVGGALTGSSAGAHASAPGSVSMIPIAFVRSALNAVIAA